MRMLLTTVMTCWAAWALGQNLDLSSWPDTTDRMVPPPLPMQAWPSAPADSEVIPTDLPGGWLTVQREGQTWLVSEAPKGHWNAWYLGQRNERMDCFCEEKWEKVAAKAGTLWAWTYCEAFSHTNAFEQNASKRVKRMYLDLKDPRQPRAVLYAEETFLEEWRWSDVEEGQPDGSAEGIFEWNELLGDKWICHMAYYGPDTLTCEWVLERRLVGQIWETLRTRQGRCFSSREEMEEYFPPISHPFCKWWFEAEPWSDPGKDPKKD